jgi:hypothetical protein
VDVRTTLNPRDSYFNLEKTLSSLCSDCLLAILFSLMNAPNFLRMDPQEKELIRTAEAPSPTVSVL